MKLKVVLSFLVIIFLVSGCSFNKNMKPYSKAQVLKYTKAIFGDDITLVSSEEIEKSPKFIKYYFKTNDRGIDFTVNSYVAEESFLGSGSGTYERRLSTDFFDKVGEFYKEEKEEIKQKYNLKIEPFFKDDTTNDTVYITKYADIAAISQLIIDLDKLYSFNYDNKVKTPMDLDSRPSIYIEYKKTDNYSLYIDPIYFSRDENRLKYEDVYNTILYGYANYIKEGKIIDYTFPQSILDSIPISRINKVYINDSLFVFPNAFSETAQYFNYNKDTNEYLLSTSFGYVINSHMDECVFKKLVEELGGTYINNNKSNQNKYKIKWTIDNNNYEATTTYSSEGYIKSLLVKKNGSNLNIKYYKADTATWDISLSTETLEELLNADITIDQKNYSINIISK